MNERKTMKEKSERDKESESFFLKIDEKMDNRLALGWKNAGYLSV